MTRHPLFLLVITHLKEFWREPGAIFWALFFPVLMAGGLGMAFTKKGELTQKIAFVSEQKQAEEFLTKRVGNEKTGYTKYEFLPVTYEEGIVLLKRGTVDMIITQDDSSYHYHYDPLNPEAQLAYLNLTSALSGRDNPGSAANVEPLTDIGNRYIDFLVPGLMAMGVMMSCMWGISYSLIEKRSKKLLRRMVATPMRKFDFMGSVLISRTIMCAVEAFLLIGFSMLFFGIRIEGNLLALVLLFISGVMTFSGLAIIVSSRTSNTYVGTGIINAVVLPMMILSGIFFSYHSFPDWAVSIIRLFPLTTFADTTRAVFIEGAGLQEVLLPVGILGTVGLMLIYAGIRVFKWY